MEMKKIAEEQEIWNEKEKTKKLVPEQFHKQIKVFGRKTSERMPTRQMQNYIIDLKEKFVPRKDIFYHQSHHRLHQCSLQGKNMRRRE